MAKLAEAGSPIPTRITSGIVLVLAAWAYCALAGAGLAPKPPLLRYLLAGIAAIYLLRGLLGFGLKKIIRGNSMEFWLWSSAICLALGLAYLVGTRQAWDSL
jgi:hypothetical protein